MSVYLAVLLLVVLCLSLGSSAVADARPEGDECRSGSAAVRENSGPGVSGKAIIVVIDRISVDDIDSLGKELPNINMLMERGCTGLMNARIRHNEYGKGSYLVIGAGGRAIGGNDVGFAFNADERIGTIDAATVSAASLYKSRMGKSAPPGSVVNLYIEQMLKKSESYLATSTPGLLGDALSDEGMSVSLVGNADSLSPEIYGFEMGEIEYIESTSTLIEITGLMDSMVTRIHREASCIAMDSGGIVPAGDVSSGLNKKNAQGTGLQTDFRALVDHSMEFLPQSSLQVIDMGQTTRVDEKEQYYTGRALRRARREALEDCDRALGDLLAGVDLEKDLVILCTPTPTRDMLRDGNTLTPVVVSGPGFEGGRYLASPTTRMSGLVSNFDIAPTVLDFLGVDIPAEMEGSPMKGADISRGLEPLIQMQDEAVYSSDIRSTMVDVFVIPAALLLILLLVLTLLKKDAVTGHPHFWSIVLLALLATPLVYFTVPLIPIRSLPWSIITALAAEFAVSVAVLFASLRASGRVSGAEGDEGEPSVLGGRFRRALIYAAFGLSAATLFCVLLDPLLGSPMVRVSPFGISVIGGARYYGLGNAAMGIAVGSAVLVAALAPAVMPRILDAYWKKALFAGSVLIVAVIIMGFPRLGANTGGFITGVIAAPVVLMKLRGWKIGWKQVALVVVLLIACIGLLLLADLVLPGSSSHAGRAVSRLQDRGLLDPLSTIARKAQMDWKLLFTSVWRYLFFAGILVALVWRWTLELFKDVRSCVPEMSAAWVGLAVAMAAALVFNDTGIEAAGAIMLFFIVPSFLLYLPCSLRRAGSIPPASDRGPGPGPGGG